MNLNGIDTASRLREICKAITEHADQFQMATWFNDQLDDNSPAGGCGTAACIGGWAHHLFAAKGGRIIESFRDSYVLFQPNLTLGLDYSEKERLFYSLGWPVKFQTDYRLAKTHIARAAIAVERISHFIATEGKE